MRTGVPDRPNSNMHDCLYRILEEQARRIPESPALLAPGRPPLTYGCLLPEAIKIVHALNATGIGKSDRVALSIPDGPEMVMSCIAVGLTATCAPLNPGYRPNELENHLTDLRARVLIVESGLESRARPVARSLGIPVLRLTAGTASEAGASPWWAKPGFRQPSLRSQDRPIPSLRCTHQARSHGRHSCHCHTAMSAFRLGTFAGGRTDFGRSLFERDAVVPHPRPEHGVRITCRWSKHRLSAGFSPAQFFECLETFRPTWYSAAPAIHQMILEKARLHPDIIARSSLRFIRSASAAMPRQLMAEMERAFKAPLIEAYGMTEAAPQIASNRLPPTPRKPGSVGLAAGPEVGIVDESGNLLPPGKPGEIVIRGSNVMEAYEDDPSANRSAFVGDWLRSGDTGYLDEDGYLFVTGRLKEIINRGGEKVSPREVEDVLLNHPAVAQAVAFPVPHPVLGEDVGAAVVLQSDASPGRSGSELEQQKQIVREIREFAAARLASFKVPQQIVMVSEIPKGATGKPRRTEMAQQLGLGSSAENTLHACPGSGPPHTPTEATLVDIWAGLLGIDHPGIHDNFFQLGGHSLLAAQVISRLRQEFGVEVPLESFFQRPTVSELAELVEEKLAGLERRKGSPIETNCSTAGLQHSRTPELTPTVELTRPIAKRPSSTAYPLSLAQKRLWFLDQLETGNAAYNISASLWLRGPLVEATLERALNEIRTRHEALRTNFHLFGAHPVQVVAPPQLVRLTVVDLTGLPVPDRKSTAVQLAAKAAEQPFDLSRDALFRAELVRLAADEHALLLTMHHLVSDGWSIGILYRELRTLYGAFLAGQRSPLQELPIQYSDFVAQEQESLAGSALEKRLDFWREELLHCPTEINLPVDRPRPVIQTCRGATLDWALSAEVTRDLKALSLSEGATPFMTLLAVFQVLLFRLTRQDRFLVGIPTSNRSQLETELLIGFFAHTLVVRADLSGDPIFTELLSRVRTTALRAFAHQDVPLEKLVQEIHPKRDLSRAPLFQVMFAFQNYPGTSPGESGKVTLELQTEGFDAADSPSPIKLAAGLQGCPLHVSREHAKIDLTLYLRETRQGLAGTWQYNSDLFLETTISRISKQFQALIEAVVSDSKRRLSEFPAEPDVRPGVAIRENRAKATDVLSCCFHRMFEEQVERAPEATAVECRTGRLSYSELNARANQLAWHLRRHGVGPEKLVGLALSRSPDMIVAALGVLKAGGAYLPLDPHYPAERLAFMLEDSGVAALVTEKSWLPIFEPALAASSSPAGQASGTGCPGSGQPLVVCLENEQQLISAESSDNPEALGSSDNLAYVIYTSGSAGRPKGVMITHSNLGHYARAMRSVIGIDARDRYLHTASFAFSSSVRQFAVPLSCGAAVVLASRDEIRDPLILFEVIRQRGVTILDIIPSYWRNCIRVLECLEPASRSVLLDNHMRTILSASEPLSADIPREWASRFLPRTQLINMYGQTETTGIVTTYPIPAADAGPSEIVPLGVPIAGARVYVLDSSRRPVPPGVTGEVYVGGATVGRGYLHQPELTSNAFVPDPFIPGSEARLYRTGDLGRNGPGGGLEFRGRGDCQVKIRGFRVELEEIEAVLQQHPRVRQAAVVAQDKTPADSTGTLADSLPSIDRGAQPLAAFLVLEDEAASSAGGPLETGEDRARVFREFLRGKLPDYMVPASFIEMKALTLTPNGKIDRKALSAQIADSTSATGTTGVPGNLPGQLVLPRTTTERLLARIWADVLPVERVGVDDNFFDLGGDSILSTQVVIRANQGSVREGEPQAAL